VIVDWDLVLTAGHCVRYLALEDFVIVFGYYYVAPGILAADMEAVDPIEIVSEALDPAGTVPRLDYAWIRLRRPPASPRRPAAIYATTPVSHLGDSVLSLGTGGGIPVKIDRGGTVLDLREQSADYFVADTDTTRGSSGGGAFDSHQALTGIMVRGETDLVQTDRGCSVTVQVPADSGAGEQFTYAQAAVSGLCDGGQSTSSLCRPDCGAPCQATALPPEPAGGCSLAVHKIEGGGSGGIVFVMTAIVLAHCRRWARRPGARLPPASGREIDWPATEPA
jgi:hypothetical protein